MPDGFNVHRKLRRPLVKRIDALERGRHRLRPGRGARLRLAAHRGRPHPPHRPGHRARHLLPPPPRPARREHRPRVHADAEPRATPRRRSSCTTARSRRSPASASSTATRRRHPSALVLWEAQFGDFANAAQVIIDSFIVSGEAKWGQTSRLTLLLPHGYEGSGPEHSSARIERFLALGAEGNIRIANPTTAAQYFHLLRRQALIRKPRPLVVFTPKGLLRLDRAASTLEDLTEGELPVHPRRPDAPRTAARRSSASSSAPARSTTTSTPASAAPSAENVAIARVEMLYPFAKEQLEERDRRLPEPEGDRLGPGGAAQHGRLEGDVAAHARSCCPRASTSPTSAARAAPARRGLRRRARARAGAHRPHRAHPRQPEAADAPPALHRSRSPSPGRLFVWVKRLSWVELAIFAACSSSGSRPGFDTETMLFGWAHGSASSSSAW